MAREDPQASQEVHQADLIAPFPIATSVKMVADLPDVVGEEGSMKDELEASWPRPAIRVGRPKSRRD